jgi:tetratricopeptide (TPR) repeat protein
MEAAILVFEEILQLRPIGHVKRAEAVGDLGKSLFLFCFYNKTDNIRRDRCFDLLREGLQLCPPGHPLRDRALHHLAMALAFVGYEQHSGGLDSLRESIILNREALHLRPDNPEQASTLENLAYGLLRLFHHSGDLDLLAEAITTYRKALSLRPPGHLKRADSLQNLASTLRSCFQHQGGSDLLAEEISLSREALQLRPVGHPQRWISLTILGNSLMFSFESKGFPELLAESICLQREAVQLVPLTEPDPGGVYISLAHSLVASFRQYRDQSALSEAIMLLRTSLRLPAGLGGDRHLETKTELAEALVANYDECKDLDHLREAVTLHRETLKSRPSGHYRRMESLQKLGHLLCRTEYQSWPEAIALYREALDVCVAGSPLRAEVLSDTSMCLLDPTSPFFDFFQGVEYLREAYADNFCHVNRRLRSAMSDLQKVESAYSVATKTGLDAATMEHCNSSVLELYAQVIGLLPRAANFGLDHRTRLQAVTGLDVIVRNAAARALLLGHVAESLEMLEEGRGVFWAQALHLRTATFDQVPRKDHQELQRLLSLLEYGARSAMSLDQSAEERERDLERRRQLNEEAEALILKIRGYAGLDRFLLPPSFDALVGALPDGYVVVVNASQVGYHALLLHRDTGLATSLKLQAPSTGFDSAALKSFLPRDIGSATDEADTRAMRKDRGREGSFLDVLTVLWTSVVQPIITELGLQVRFLALVPNRTLTWSISESSWACAASALVVCHRRARIPPDPCGGQLSPHQPRVCCGLRRVLLHSYAVISHSG